MSKILFGSDSWSVGMGVPPAKLHEKPAEAQGFPDVRGGFSNLSRSITG
jgi:hypothetical protein